MKAIQRHPFHLINPSSYPLTSSLNVCLVALGTVLLMHSYKDAIIPLEWGTFFLFISVTLWLRDVIFEGRLGHHTLKVQKNLRYGMVLFIVSEIMFFFGFFWAFFASSLAPSIEIGCIWPPVYLTPMDPFGVPLLNTVILLFSGFTVTIAHEYIIIGDKKKTYISLLVTIILALFFTFLQAIEYLEASFSITDSVYGSTFYMATGFHGFHVLIGTFFLYVCLQRLKFDHFTRDHHFGFEAAAWYWHFVDVVWIFLFISIYWWGSI